MKFSTMRLLCLWLCLSLAGVAGTCPVRADPVPDFDATWGRLTRSATTGQAKADLAEAIVKQVLARGELDALRAEERAGVLYTLDQAATLGAADPAGYPVAARALGLISQIDPAQHPACLARLVPMYQWVYRQAPDKNLGIGRRLAELQVEIAEAMERSLEVKLPANAGAMAARADTFEAITKAYRQASSTSQAVLAASRSLLTRIDRGSLRATQQQRDSLAGFVEELGPFDTAVQDQQSQALTEARAWRVVERETRVLEKDPHAQAAITRLVTASVEELDLPKLAVKWMENAAEPDRDLPRLACVSPRRLTAEQAMRLSGWYFDRARGSAADNQSRLMVRAVMYLDQARRAAAREGARQGTGWTPEQRDAFAARERTYTDLIQGRKLDADRIRQQAAAMPDVRWPPRVVVRPKPQPKVPDVLAGFVQPEGKTPPAAPNETTPNTTTPVTPEMPAEAAPSGPVVNPPEGKAVEPEPGEGTASTPETPPSTEVESVRPAKASLLKKERRNIFDFGQ